MSLLEIVDKERQMELINSSSPILKQLRDVKVAVVFPMPRYYAGGCCDERQHVSNRFEINIVN
jgi:hypothetical protein